MPKSKLEREKNKIPPNTTALSKSASEVTKRYRASADTETAEYFSNILTFLPSVWGNSFS